MPCSRIAWAQVSACAALLSIKVPSTSKRKAETRSISGIQQAVQNLCRTVGRHCFCKCERVPTRSHFPHARTALLVVDVLNPFDFPGGAAFARRAVRVARKIAQLKMR